MSPGCQHVVNKKWDLAKSPVDLNHAVKDAGYEALDRLDPVEK